MRSERAAPAPAAGLAHVLSARVRTALTVGPHDGSGARCRACSSPAAALAGGCHDAQMLAFVCITSRMILPRICRGRAPVMRQLSDFIEDAAGVPLEPAFELGDRYQAQAPAAHERRWRCSYGPIAAASAFWIGAHGSGPVRVGLTASQRPSAIPRSLST
jgi:hypothetical protein